MGRVVYLHIGAPKTGTTYLQDRLSRNAKSLARHGVHVPTGSPFVSPALFHFRAALDLLDQDWGGRPGHAEGSWDALVKRVRRSSGTVVVSHEILAPARAEHVERVLADLDGSEVHVVYSARDLGRALPAAWQESIKQGRRWTFRRFLKLCETASPWFIRAFDLPAVLSTWGAELAPSRVHVVTVPQRGRRLADDDSLWLRLCRAFGIDPAWAPADSDRSNPSLGMAETQLLRQLNRRLGRHPRKRTPYDAVVHEQLVPHVLGNPRSAPVRLPPAAHDWVEERTRQWFDHLEQSGVDVIGDLDDLRPVWDDAASWENPDRVPARQRLDAAVDALAAMTDEVAKRPAPPARVLRKMRANAHRLRPR